MKKDLKLTTKKDAKGDEDIIQEGLDKLYSPKDTKESWGQKVQRVKMLYRGVVNLDVEPNRYEFPKLSAADEALDSLLSEAREEGRKEI